MISVKHNLEFTKGDTNAFAIKFENLEEGFDTVYLTCREDKDDTSEMLFQKSLDNGITKYEEDKYKFRIAPEDTQDLEEGTYYYDIEIGKNGDIYTLVKGKIKLTWESTKRGE